MNDQTPKPLTEDERQQAFVAAMQALEAQYGFTVKSSLFMQGLGVVLEVAGNNPIKPGPPVITPIVGWSGATV